MPFIAPLIGAGISGLAGFFGGGKQQSQKSSSTTDSSQQGSYTNNSSGNSSFDSNSGQSYVSGTSHVLSPFQQQLASMFTKGAVDQYNQSTDLSGYKASGLQQINQAGNAARTISDNSLASRGLSFSPNASFATNQVEGNRLGQSASFINSLPMLQRQLQQQSLGNLVSAFSALPTDSVTSGSSTGFQSGTGSQSSTSSGTQDINSHGTTNSTGSTSGNPIGGLLGGLGAGFAGGGGFDWLNKLFGGGGGGQAFSGVGAFGG